MSTPQKLGFIGLGIMGAPMAGHLAKAGHRLFVTTRSTVRDEIKQAGATVCRRGQRLSWPGGVAIALAKDRAGRVLPRWRGCRTLGPDERLVIGDTSLSFDSRYFGPVTTADIDGVYEEVWRW